MSRILNSCKVTLFFSFFLPADMLSNWCLDFLMVKMIIILFAVKSSPKGFSTAFCPFIRHPVSSLFNLNLLECATQPNSDQTDLSWAPAKKQSPLEVTIYCNILMELFFELRKTHEYLDMNAITSEHECSKFYIWTHKCGNSNFFQTSNNENVVSDITYTGNTPCQV